MTTTAIITEFGDTDRGDAITIVDLDAPNWSEQLREDQKSAVDAAVAVGNWVTMGKTIVHISNRSIFEHHNKNGVNK